MNKFKQIFTSITLIFVFLFIAFVTYNLAEPKVYDFMTKQFLIQKLPFDTNKKVFGNDNIVLVITDSRTVGKYRWPWKRNIDSDILGYFTEYAKPKLIVDDTIFVTLDKTSPEADKKFFKKIKSMDNYVAGFMPNMLPWKEPVSGKKYGEIFANKYSLKVKENDSKSNVPYHSMISSPYQYLDSSNSLGHVYVPVGALNKNISYWAFDNITRTNEYVIKYPNAFYPSIAMQAYLMLNNPESIIIKNRYLNIKSDDERKIKLLKKSHLYSGLKKVNLDTYSNPIKFYKIYPQTGYSHINYSTGDILDSYYALKSGKKPIINPEIFKD